MIPKILHFILISKTGHTPPRMEYYMYVAIKSAITYNPDSIIHLYVTAGLLPSGVWFDRLRDEYQIKLNLSICFNAFRGARYNLIYNE